MLLQQLINGLTIGCSYALVTIGFSMVWSILQLTNLAHSAFYMTGPYLTLFILLQWGPTPTNFFIALVISSLFTASLGAMMEKFLLQPIRKRTTSNIATMLCTVGVQTVIVNTLIVIFGAEAKSFPNVLNLGKFKIGNAIVTYQQVITLCVAVVLMLAMSFIVYRTKLGVAMRAVSQNTSAAHLMGINVSFVVMCTFFLGTLVAAIAGSMVAMYYQAIDTTMSAVIGSKAMASAVLGGVGVLPGAMLGSIIIGITETLVASYISSGYRDAIAFAVLILVIIIRPTGMFGKKTINKV